MKIVAIAFESKHNTDTTSQDDVGVMYFDMANYNVVLKQLQSTRYTRAYDVKPDGAGFAAPLEGQFLSIQNCGFQLLFRRPKGSKFFPKFNNTVDFSVVTELIKSIGIEKFLEGDPSYIQSEETAKGLGSVTTGLSNQTALDVLTFLTKQMNDVGLTLTPEQENLLLHNCVKELTAEVHRLNNIIDQNKCLSASLLPTVSNF